MAVRSAHSLSSLPWLFAMRQAYSRCAADHQFSSSTIWASEARSTTALMTDCQPLGCNVATAHALMPTSWAPMRSESNFTLLASASERLDNAAWALPLTTEPSSLAIAVRSRTVRCAPIFDERATARSRSRTKSGPVEGTQRSAPKDQRKSITSSWPCLLMSNSLARPHKASNSASLRSLNLAKDQIICAASLPLSSERRPSAAAAISSSSGSMNTPIRPNAPAKMASPCGVNLASECRAASLASDMSLLSRTLSLPKDHRRLDSSCGPKFQTSARAARATFRARGPVPLTFGSLARAHARFANPWRSKCSRCFPAAATTAFAVSESLMPSEPRE
mmetsp:Transcript_39322/g.71283  ORF Transcript_39322/g.71283 Transcript_39322/m.71283 type:complete len:335 (+) Transcript_39322:140-1144(+)